MSTCARLAGCMCAGMKKLDRRTRHNVEKVLEDALGANDYAEWLQFKKLRKTKPNGCAQRVIEEEEEEEEERNGVDLLSRDEVDSKPSRCVSANTQNRGECSLQDGQRSV